MPRRQPRDVLGHLSQAGFTVLQCDRGFMSNFRCLGQAGIMPLRRLGQFLRFPLQAFDRFACIAVQTTFAVDIVAQLFDPALQRGNHVPRARLFIGQPVTLHGQTLQQSCGNRLFFPQGRQGFIGLDPGRRRLPCGCFGLSRFRCATAQGFLRSQTGIVCLAPAAIQKHAFGFAQRFTNFAIARSLFGLARQLLQLVSQLFDHVIDARQITLCTLQL